ncbi:hypothetical protein VNO78_30778 [Psophocarpus tetragonolobus]|uniref:Uncharacterized protein n=1 Tax=Psophocarpus tetragonolobus TaxID=3891 RepID=A0AAN9RXH0_PSOTE
MNKKVRTHEIRRRGDDQSAADREPAARQPPYVPPLTLAESRAIAKARPHNSQGLETLASGLAFAIALLSANVNGGTYGGWRVADFPVGGALVITVAADFQFQFLQLHLQ